MIGLFLSAAALGLTFCAAPGIVSAEAIRRGVAHGFRSALAVQLGSLIGDMFWAIVALIGIAFVVTVPAVQVILGIVGTCFLLYLAWDAFTNARKGTVPQAKTDATQGDFAAGTVLSMGNPFAVAFWLGVGTNTLSAHTPDPQLIHFAVFLGAFLLAGLAWAFFMTGLITWGRQFVNPTFFRVLNFACALVLVYFALRLVWDTYIALMT